MISFTIASSPLSMGRQPTKDFGAPPYYTPKGRGCQSASTASQPEAVFLMWARKSRPIFRIERPC